MEKIKPIPYQQKMGDLPIQRTEPIRLFLKSGVDYCGPAVLTKEGDARSKRQIKAYIALFVCLSTKAVHIELVKDLSSDSFLNAFRRFISRRGRVSHILSDNANNFIGAKRILTELSKFLMGDEFHKNFITTITNEQVKWSFSRAGLIIKVEINWTLTQDYQK